ncbi:MAG TPA: hypothetical protein VFN01_04525 [Marinobacter sp.]|uniref:hypothetical protein n=1 Tax=Marinobacter sp. TaxID=50741 RepID=UPI002D80CE10|nr:hypothetical protein [Marinobacter sp.]HET8800429.1 hypothetical protein [Marinobacter sp.]
MPEQSSLQALFDTLPQTGRVEWIGGVVLEYTGLCHPCSKMESDFLDSEGFRRMLGDT